MNSWKNEKSTKLQRKKIADLLKAHEDLRLNHALEDLTKLQADYLIKSLLSGKLEKLLEKKVLLPSQPSTSLKRSTPGIERSVKYRVSDGGHFYSYTDFRTSVGGKLLEYKMDGSEILYQIIEVEKEISAEMMKKYDLKITRVED